MNIVILHHFGGVGGGTNSCIDVARILSELGHHVTICISNPKEDVLNIIKSNGIEVRTDVPPFVVLNYHSASRSRIKAIVKFVRSRRSLRCWEAYLSALKPELIILNSIVQSPLIEVANNIGINCICFVRETICGKVLRQSA